jgi:hypothetical protein
VLRVALQQLGARCVEAEGQTRRVGVERIGGVNDGLSGEGRGVLANKRLGSRPREDDRIRAQEGVIDGFGDKARRDFRLARTENNDVAVGLEGCA